MGFQLVSLPEFWTINSINCTYVLAEHGSVSALQIAGQADERVSPRKTGEVRYDLCTKILCTNHRKAGPCFNQSEDQFTPGFLPKTLVLLVDLSNSKTRMFWDFLRGCLKRGGTFERQHHLLRLLRDFHWRLTLKQQRCYAASAGRPVVASCSAPRHSWRQFACGCWPRERGASKMRGGGFKDLVILGYFRKQRNWIDRKVIGHLSSYII